MKIKIIKNKSNDYTLELQSGHFRGVLDSIPEASIDELINSLQKAKAGEVNLVRVWNPRAQKHVYVPEAEVANNQ